MKKTLMTVILTTTLSILPSLSHANDYQGENARLHITIHNRTGHTLDCTQNQQVDDGTLYNVNAQHILPEDTGLFRHQGKTFGRMQSTLECRTEKGNNVATLHYNTRNMSRSFVTTLFAFMPLSILIYACHGRLKVSADAAPGYAVITNKSHFRRIRSMHQLLEVTIENT